MAPRVFLHVTVLSLCLALPSASRASEDAYTGFIKSVQEKLRMLGFDAGPVNGDFGHKTQAALAQFQLSRTLPASGSLDDETLAELGVKREIAQAEASAGATEPGNQAQAENGTPR